MYTNINFIGGIHGVGKGTICDKIESESNLIHLSASDVLNWGEISDLKNKRVSRFDESQNRLLTGLKNVINPNKEYLLDGHFCLLNIEGLPEKVHEKTFMVINPRTISVVIEDPEIIFYRLLQRDGKGYDLSILAQMQEMEIEYAKKLSIKFNIPYFEIINGNYSDLLNHLS